MYGMFSSRFRNRATSAARQYPVVVQIDTLQFGRTEQAAVAITAISAFAAGFEIFVTARIRPGARSGHGDRMPIRRCPSPGSRALGKSTLGGGGCAETTAPGYAR